MRSLRRYVLIACALSAAGTGAYSYAQHVKSRALPVGLRAFDAYAPAPACASAKDTMPATREAAPYQRYIDARKLWRSKIEGELTHEETRRILNGVQGAASQGDWGARALMAYFYRSGLGPGKSNHVLDADFDKSVEIGRAAVAAGQAWGFHDLGVAHASGYGGAVKSDQIAWAYFLKAAELGSPDAQMTLAGAYAKINREHFEQAMLRCAYLQGHGPAALRLGKYALSLNYFGTALEYYQAGTKFRNILSTVAMRQFFEEKNWHMLARQDRVALMQLGVLPDPEGEQRYRQIASALDANPDLRPTMLNLVIPLPPAKLPPWSGVQDTIELEADIVATY